MKTKLILLGLLVILLVGCSAKTPEGSCYNACEESHNCEYIKDRDSEQVKQQKTQCQIGCWNACYSHIINENVSITEVME